MQKTKMVEPREVEIVAAPERGSAGCPDASVVRLELATLVPVRQRSVWCLPQTFFQVAPALGPPLVELLLLEAVSDHGA